MCIRTSGFRIGCFHGKLVPDHSNREIILRNQLYLIGMLKLKISETESKQITIVAFEMPLRRATRSKSVDLFGYDQDKTPCLIELKHSGATDTIKNIRKQLDGYVQLFNETRKHVEKEIQCKYLWPEFHFSEGLLRIIAAPREFFDKNKKDVGPSFSKSEPRVYVCSFKRIKTESIESPHFPLLEKRRNKGCVELRIENG